jgi:hypothetical protein
LAGAASATGGAGGTSATGGAGGTSATDVGSGSVVCAETVGCAFADPLRRPPPFLRWAFSGDDARAAAAGSAAGVAWASGPVVAGALAGSTGTAGGAAVVAGVLVEALVGFEPFGRVERLRDIVVQGTTRKSGREIGEPSHHASTCPLVVVDQGWSMASIAPARTRTFMRGDRLSVMATCKGCGEDADELIGIKVGNKTVRLCEDCADRAREQSEIAEQSEAVVQQMMGFKGRR